jgi:hypothetical protein
MEEATDVNGVAMILTVAIIAWATVKIVAAMFGGSDKGDEDDGE